MNIYNRSISFILGALITVTPVCAFAHDHDASASPSDTEVQLPLNSLEVGDHSSEGASAAAIVNASTSGRMGVRGVREGGLDDGAHIQARADSGIDARISLLERLSTRLENTTLLSTNTKSSLSATLTTQIQQLTALKAKIGSDTSASSMRDDAGSIRPEFRTYAFVLPSVAITAASDRILAITSQMETVGTKLSARIDDASNAGVNVTTAQSAYADYTAKVSDAKVQASAAATLIANLQTDNGDKAVFTANSTAFKSAAAKLKIAQQDLKDARADITEIVKVIKGTGVNAEATSTVSTN